MPHLETCSIPQKLLAGLPLSDSDQALLLASARRLDLARQAGTHGLLLPGRHLALMAQVNDPVAQLFRQAGTQLGAQVALVAPLAANASPGDLLATARMLSQLYDAVECQGMPATLVRDLAQAAAVPVFDGLATPEHPCHLLHPMLVPLLHAQASLASHRLLGVQAVLLTVVN